MYLLRTTILAADIYQLTSDKQHGWCCHMESNGCHGILCCLWSDMLLIRNGNTSVTLTFKIMQVRH